MHKYKDEFEQTLFVYVLQKKKQYLNAIHASLSLHLTKKKKKQNS